MSANKKMSKAKILRLTQNAMLAAIVVLMAFTPVGYLQIGLVKMTFIMIPVAVGAITLGKGSGIFLGLVFGLTSLVQCFGLDAFGTTLFNISPLGTVVMCLVPRVLMGLGCSLVYTAVKGKNEYFARVLASLSAPLINTVLFVGLMLIFFGNSDYIMSMRGESSLLAFLVAFVGLNGIIEIITTTVIAPPIALATEKAVKKFK